MKNLTLSDARITGHIYVGGIVGAELSVSIIENCHVTNTVDIHAATGSSHHGGIVGFNRNSTVRDCTSAAVVDYADGLSTCMSFGGIVGYNHQGTVENCLALGCVVKSSYETGAIVGDNFSGTLSHNYYYCTVNGATGSGIGCGDPAGDITENDGAVPLNNNALSLLWSTGDGTAESPYLITSCKELDALALVTNAGYNLNNKRFKLGNDISYPHTTAWDDAHSTENNYTTIGNGYNIFYGIFDGDGHTVSGIRIYKGGNANADSYQGLFGRSISVRNLTLSDARITGYYFVGGIAGQNSISIKNCHVTATVAIYTVVNNANCHGGIVGDNSYGEMSYCTSAATLSVANGVSDCENYGGIAGCNNNSIQNCLVAGANISGNLYVGTIVGYHNGYPDKGLKFNYYYNCTVNGNANASGVGCGRSNSYSSQQDISQNSGAISAQVVSRSIEGYGNSTGSDHWAFIASPMSWLYEEYQTPHHVQQLMATPAGHYDLYRFNQAAAGAEWQNYKAHAGSDAQGDVDFRIENGQGYLYASKEDVTLTFLGNPYSNTIRTVTLSYTEGKPLAGYNLVGNPFAVDATLDRSYYRMNDTGTGLVAEAADTPIAPCTGVIVQTTAAEVAANENKVTFTKATRGETFASKGRLNIALVGTRDTGHEDIIDNAIVSFDEGAELGKFYFGEQDANLYLPQDGNDYAIVSAEVHGEIPVNFKARQNGEYTLTVSSTFNFQFSIFRLIDNLTGANINLLTTPSYTFTAKTTDYASRFKLVFNANENDNENQNDDFAFISNGEILVNGEGTLQVIDILGHVLVNRETHSGSCLLTSDFSAGIYVLRLINGEKVKTQKVVIE